VVTAILSWQNVKYSAQKTSIKLGNYGELLKNSFLVFNLLFHKAWPQQTGVFYGVLKP